MTSEMWSWFVHSSAGLATRVMLGAAIFAALAVADYRKNRQRATRWREYAFLLAVTAIVCLYGVLNDQLTSSISWEYFYYGKGLSESLGDATPPDPLSLHLQAALVGLKATWSAGLMVGVTLLLANNPSPTRSRLPYKRLFVRLPLMLAITIVTAALFATLGHLGLFTHFSHDFAQMLARNEFRPRRFMTTFGLHLGAYVGGLLATIIAVVSIRKERTRFTTADNAD